MGNSKRKYFYSVLLFLLFIDFPSSNSFGLMNSYSNAFNPGNPFIYEVPPVVQFVLNMGLNKTKTILNNVYGFEPQFTIQDNNYLYAKYCGVHFINPGEGYIVTDKMFGESFGPVRCTISFVGSQFCTPSADCPKFRDRGKKANCRSNYLQITDAGESFLLHSCNSTRSAIKTREFTSVSGLLDLTYRYSNKFFKPEFECRVKCVPYKVQFEIKKSERNMTEVKVLLAERPQNLEKNLPKTKYLPKCKCGISPNETIVKKKEGRILGGKETKVHQYPWMVGIINKERASTSNNSRLPFCGGSLINDRYVLTAAHCLLDEETRDLVVVLREHDFFNESETDGPAIRVDITEIIPYHYYLDNTFYGDLALLRLAKPVDITDPNLTPICLPHNMEEDFVGVEAVAAGWGTTKDGGDKSRVLRDVVLKIMGNPACNDYHYSTPPEPLQVTDNMLCAGYSQGGKDTCSGDSGGWLAIVNKGRYTQIGVTSWGYGCGMRLNPGVFARVTAFLYWIRMNTLDAHWCS